MKYPLEKYAKNLSIEEDVYLPKYLSFTKIYLICLTNFKLDLLNYHRFKNWTG